MKKIIILLFSVVFLFSACTAEQKQPEAKPPVIQSEKPEEIYFKGVWFTYYELQNLMSYEEAVFTDNIRNAFEKVKSMGFNTVLVQVRPCADSFYKSMYFPTSRYCFGEQGIELPFDPLAIMCSTARDTGLRIEAWINPYRVSQDGDINSLCDSNIAKIWHYDNSTKRNVIILKKGIYFNPAMKPVVDLITNGVAEIVSNYDIDGIHFDDYFYPAIKEKHDSKEYKSYKNSGGDMSLAEWRRENVNIMIRTVYAVIKSIKPEVAFGISPASDINNDYKSLYADVRRWVTNEGYVDYICPQIYFGFKNVSQPFMFTTKKWIGITKSCKLYVGLPLYKCGKPDKYAAHEEKERINEFVNNSNIIARQITYLSKLDEVNGFCIFSYSYLLDESKSEEVSNMQTAMQSSNPQ